MKAQYKKTLYDHIASRPHLDIVVVKEVHKLLNGEK